MRRAVVALTAAVVVAFGSGVTASETEAAVRAKAAPVAADAVQADAVQAGGVQADAVSWRSCRAPFQCAEVKVPLDYDNPSGAKIEIAMVRLRATEPGRKIGTIFLNPGGPGGSGVDFVRGAGEFLFSPTVRARFDLVGFDPRGIGRSKPLTCFFTFAGIPDYPRPFPLTRSQERTYVAADNDFSSKCAANAGAIGSHMSTANVARDLDVMREAVGDERLTYAGYSYGTMLGATYANLFPDKVRALVLDGVVDPVAWSTGTPSVDDHLPASTRLRSDDGAWDTLRSFFRQCDRYPRRCRFSNGNAQREYAKIAERLKAEELVLVYEDGTRERLGYNELVSITLSGLYGAAEWPLMANFFEQIDQVSRGLSVGARTLRAPAFAERPGQTLEGFPGVLCSETDNPASPTAWKTAGRAADLTSPYFGRPWTWASSVCASWPFTDDDRYAGPYTANTFRPVLVVGTRFDPATRYESAVGLAGLMPNSRLLTLEGWGHTSLFSSRCIDRHVNRYLVDRIVPPEGATCEADAGPFDTTRQQANAAERASVRRSVLPGPPPSR